MLIHKHVCDICGKDLLNEGDIKFKWKARKHWYAYPCDSGWERIELCADCIEAIKRVRVADSEVK